MRELLLITFLLFSSFAFSQEETETEKVKDQTESKEQVKEDCVCTCHKSLSNYDELKRIKELYNNSVINLREYEKIRKKIIKAINKTEYDK